jgi:pimeloyl-ACP methyl ester carboxylesterase
MKTLLSALLLTIFLLLGAAPGACAQETDGFVDVANGKLHVVQAGDGPYTVVFEAGFVSDLRVWNKVAPAVAKNARILAYSRAGVGKSPARGQTLNLVQHAEELQQLITAAKVKTPVILVGHSYGGFVVRQFAATYPSLVAGLVMVDPAQETLEVELKKLDAGKVEEDQKRLASLAPPSAKADLALIEAIFAQAKLPNTAALPDVPTVVLTSVHPTRNNPFFQETAPALLVKRDIHAQFARQFSNSTHTVTSRSSHHVQMDEPHLVVAAIQQVITSLTIEAEKQARQKAKQQARQAVMTLLEKAAAQLQSNQAPAAQDTVHAALKASAFSEAEINQLGFDLLGKAKQPVLAELVLGFNVVQFPQSDNAFDSHGEALLELRRPQEAKAQFLKAVALGKVNPQRSPKALRGFEDNLQKAEAAIKATP